MLLKDPVWSNEGPRSVMDLFGVSFCARIAVFIARSPKGDLGHQGHLGDLLPKIGLLKVTFLFKISFPKEMTMGTCSTQYLLLTKLRDDFNKKKREKG